MFYKDIKNWIKEKGKRNRSQCLLERCHCKVTEKLASAARAPLVHHRWPPQKHTLG